MAQRIDVSEYQTPKKRKGGRWPLYVALGAGIISGYLGISSCDTRHQETPAMETPAIYGPWSEGGHRLTKEQARNPGTVICPCAENLRKERVIVDSNDVRDAISAQFEQEHGIKLNWGNLHENDRIPLPKICEEKYNH